MRSVVAAVEEPAVGRNYYRVGVEARDSAAGAILFNAAAVLIAAAEVADPQEIALVFAAVPGSGVFTERGFQVASPAQLNEPLSEPHLHTLTADERRVVRLTRDACERDAVRQSAAEWVPCPPGGTSAGGRILV